MRFLLLVLLLLPAISTAATDIEPLPPAKASSRPGSQVLLEAALVKPLGDLAEDFGTTDLGFGASAGFEVGFRLRLHLSRRWSLAPAFHFVDYGDYQGILPPEDPEDPDAEGEEFDVKTSSQRFSVELRYAFRDHAESWQPFLAAAGGIYRNRVQGYDKSFIEVVDESVNTLGLEVRAGLRAGQLEFSAYYVFNRFSTWTFFNTGYDTPYDWDAVGFRLGWIIPFEN